ncbi:DUF3558 family protein [Corynebacterium sanguinis]|uniref:DUF3558 family protein n=2 Tax=Corynebacterium sanguinis TaxID=2594913 RepID=UPI0028834334|nr:DUF3558 family protein [Corynebacterium sanguinis]
MELNSAVAECCAVAGGGVGRQNRRCSLGLRQFGGLSVRRFGVVVGLFGVVGLVSGCASGAGVGVLGQTGAAGPASSEAAVSPEPTAFHFDSGDLVIGPFDPEEVKHNLFDPCKEISDAEFAAAGLVKSEVQPEPRVLSDRFIVTCAIEGEDPYTETLLVTNAAPKSVILSTSQQFNFHSAQVPEIFAFGPPNGGTEMCDVAVETKRGTFSASVFTYRASGDVTDLCAKAADTLGKLYLVG